MTRTIVRSSWAVLSAAVLLMVTALVADWGVNAEALGARNLGLAIALASASAIAYTAALWFAPVCVLAGLLAWRVHRPSGLRLLAAGALCALPIAAG